MPLAELLERCTVQQRDDPTYVPSECLLHLVRSCRAGSSSYFEQLYRILAERVLRRLPKGEGRLGDILAREDTFGQFAELLAKDHHSYAENLDYFEIRFDQALMRLRIGAERQVRRDENRSTPLDAGQEANALSAEVERAAGSFDPFAAPEADAAYYRSSLDAAIDSLPRMQRRIVEMLRQGIPIDSKDPDTVTVAKALGKCEKTIRTHRDKAYAALRLALKRGEMP